MKITVYPDSGNPVVLGDDAAGHKIAEDLPQQARLIQDAPLFRAPYRKQFARLNRVNTFTFRTDREHRTAAEAVAFKRDHCDAVPVAGVIEVKEEGRTRWLERGLIPQVSCVFHQGRTTVFTYTITGGEWLANKPNLT
jgi:hypothetical protein